MPTEQPVSVATPPTSPVATITPTSMQAGAAPAAELAADPPIWYSYEVLAEFPHDANAFTQGLLFDEGNLYEGTGLYGESTVRRVELNTGTVEQEIAIPDEYFGEGITIVGDKIYQLTWREQTGFIYNKQTLEKTGEFTYPTEGWGLTYDGAHIIMSDGTDRLFFINPETMAIVAEQPVSMVDPADGQRKAIPRLNELEYARGEIFANVWQTDVIVRIDPSSGNVTGVIDLTGLLAAADRTSTTDVLNGIAYLPETDQLFVTGKKWPKLFEIRLVKE
ncbi:MAG: glutaminyl-peptide cyclotransferase [Caldilineaceae bacterium]